MIRFFFDQTLVLGTLVRTGNKSEYQTFTMVPGNIRPAGDESSAIDEGVFGKIYKVYLPNEITVKQGDIIKDEAGAMYKIRDWQIRNFGAMDYIEAIIIRTEFLP